MDRPPYAVTIMLIIREVPVTLIVDVSLAIVVHLSSFMPSPTLYIRSQGVVTTISAVLTPVTGIKI